MIFQFFVRAVPNYLEAGDWMKSFSMKYPNPTSVGFDIDDTLLFSSPAFYYLKDFEGLKVGEEEFWKRLNNGLDKFSLPKLVSEDILNFHKKREDEIYIITRRTKTEPEKVSDILEKVF